MNVIVIFFPQISQITQTYLFSSMKFAESAVDWFKWMLNVFKFYLPQIGLITQILIF